MIFNGILTALITPFKEKNIDFDVLELLVNRQIEAGIDGIVVGGSTGEGSSLSDQEYYELIKAVSKYSKGKIPIIAGLTGVSTSSVCEKVSVLSGINIIPSSSLNQPNEFQSEIAQRTEVREHKRDLQNSLGSFKGELGIDGLMCTAPHYIRPEQEGLYQHFKALNDSSKLPIMIYLHPGRTGCDMSDDTILKLSECERIVALKDCSSDFEKPLRILPQLKSAFVLLTGDDSRFLAYSANGGVGCVSVIANIFPKICKKIENLWRVGNLTKARELQQKLMPLTLSIFKESSPIGIKCAAHQLELCSDEIRLPLTKAREETRRKISEFIRDIKGLEENV